MILNERLDKFEKKVGNIPSNFLSKFADYKANRKWLGISSKVAVNVLEALRDKGLSQRDLAEKMQISAQQINKIVKGQQNLTLETICKLEEALDIPLIKTVDYISTNQIEVKSTTIKKGVQTDETITTVVSKPNNIENFNRHAKASMTVIYNSKEEYLIAV